MKKLFLLSLVLVFCISLNAQDGPNLETVTLKNGLKIYFIKYGKIEAMHLRVIVNSGKKNEIPGQQGYNSLVANLVLKGNKKYNEDQQNDKAFAIGCDLKSEVGLDRSGISANFLSKDANIALDLMSAAVMQAKFDKEKVEQLVSYQVSYNNPAKMDISNLTALYSNLCVYGLENPLGRSATKTQLKLVTPEKLRAFYEFNYTPKNTKIIVCGNFNLEEIKKLVETYFGEWQSTYGEVNGVLLEMPHIKNKDIFFINRNEANQCALRWNKLGPSVKDKDYLAFTIANHIFSEVLFREIREKGGKTYSIGSAHSTSQFSNLLIIACSVRSEELLNTINLFDKTLSDFSKGIFTKDEFDIEITRFKTDMFTNEYPEEIANFYNPIVYDFNARKNILAELNKLTMEDIKKVIKKYYTPEIYKLVIAGDETRVNTQLAQLKDLKKLNQIDLEY